MWLHELAVIRLNKGLAVFRPAMTVRLAKGERRGFANADFKPLALHYKGQVLQVHAMAAIRRARARRHARRARPGAGPVHAGGGSVPRPLAARPGQGHPPARPTPESWRAIVECLKNPEHQRIVADDREQMNVLVLAGPSIRHDAGAGAPDRLPGPRPTTRMRAASWQLGYNRHAAVDIRRRLLRTDRRRRARRDRAHLPRARHAPRGRQLQRPGGDGPTTACSTR